MPGYYPICIPADVQVTTMGPAGPLQPGSMAPPFTVTVKNNGENPADGSSVVTTLPPGVKPADVTWTCTAMGGAMCPANMGMGPLPTTVDTLPKDGSVTYTVNLGPVPATTPTGTLPLTVAAQPPPGFTDPTPANNTGTAAPPIAGSTMMVPKSDLEVKITTSPMMPKPGEEATVTITAKNNGPDPATKPVAVFTIPPGATVTTPPPMGDPMSDWDCTSQGTMNTGITYTCTMKKDLPAGMPAMPIVVKFKTPLDMPGMMPPGTPQVTVVVGSPGSTDPNPGNNTATVDVGPKKTEPMADLALTVTKSPMTAGPGMETTFTMQVTNNGPDAVPQGEVTFTVPPGSIVTQPAMGSGWACTRTADTFHCVTGQIPKGMAAPITVKIVAPTPKDPMMDPGSVTGVVSSPVVRDTNPANNTDSQPIASSSTVKPTGSDLSVKITTDNPMPMPGDTVTYTGVAKNAGPDPVKNPSVLINLPPGAEVVQPPAGTGWSCTQTGSTVLCTRPQIDQGEAPPITVKVKYPTPTSPSGSMTPPIPVTAVVDAPANNDPNPTNNTSTVDTRPLGPRTPSDLELDITKTPQNAGPGTETTYTMQVTNKGPVPVQNPSVTFTVPPGSTITQPAMGNGWTCVQAGYSVTCNYPGAMPVGPAPPITVKVNTPVPSPDPMKDPGVVAGVVSSPSNDDPDLLNNTDAVDVGVTSPTKGDLSIKISTSPQSPKGGDEVIYTAEPTNNGPGEVKNPTVTIVVPPGAEVVEEPKGDGWTCTRDSNVILCTRESVPVGPAPPIKVKIKLPTMGTGPNGSIPPARASVDASNNDDPDLTNNVASSISERLTGGGFSCSTVGGTGSSSASALLLGMALCAVAVRRRRRDELAS
jgi:uncharacterized repeat protein (TIGR01451 family)